MATLNIGIKYAGQINQAGTTSTTFVVPSGQYFRGYVSGRVDTVNSFAGCHPVIRIRQNNVSGAIIAVGGSSNSQGAFQGSDNSVSHAFTPSMFVELGAGTYFVHGELVGQTGSANLASTHVCGVLMANTQ